MAAPAPYDQASVLGIAGDADLLAAALEEIGVNAIELAHTVAPGLHGRRRPGIGDTFWEYRHFAEGDHAYQIDWRRSGRSEVGHYFVREKEFETAQTVWLWTDLTASMGFRSDLAPAAKVDRALLLMLALAQLLVHGGERVAMPGPMLPTSHRRAPRLIAEHLAAGIEEAHDRFPAAELVTAGSTCVIFSDFLDPVPEIAESLAEIAENGVGIHLVEIVDPAEDLLPYSGRTEFVPSEGGRPFVAGKAETLREDYAIALAAHRDALRHEANLLGASILSHRTDHSPEMALLALSARIAEGDFEIGEMPDQDTAGGSERVASP